MFPRLGRVVGAAVRRPASATGARPFRAAAAPPRRAFVNRLAFSALALTGSSLIVFSVAHAAEKDDDDQVFDFDSEPETMIYFPMIRHYLMEHDLLTILKERGFPKVDRSQRLSYKGLYPDPVEYPEAKRDGYEEAYAIAKETVTGITAQAKAWAKRLELPEIKEMIQVVKEKARAGQMSLHPWFPTHRERLDQFWSYYRPEVHGLMMEPMLPPRVAMPFGKPLTVVIDASVLSSREYGNRPGVDRFLSTLMQKYEIIVYGDKIEDVTEIDPSRLLVTYHLASGTNRNVPKAFFKSARALNRPIENTLVIDTNPENVFHNPNNAIIVKPWDGFDITESTLPDLLELLEYQATMVVENKKPIFEVCPQFHHVDYDAVEVWRTKRDELMQE